MKIILVCLIIFLTSCNVKKQPAVVAQIGEKELTYLSFKKQITFELQQLNKYQSIQTNQLEEVSHKIVDNFIYQNLILNWVEIKNIFIHPSVLEKKISMIKSHYPNSKYFAQELKSQNLTEADWVNKVKFSMLEEMALNTIKSKLADPSDQELLQFYNDNPQNFVSAEKIKIRQIITKDEDQAKSALNALRNGYSFSKIYLKYSQTYKQYKQPQEIWIENNEKSLFKGIFKLSKGGHSPIFKSSFGFHIAQLIDRKKKQKHSFKEAKSKVRQLVSQKSQRQKLIQWLKAELGEKKIFINKELIKKVQFEQKVR